MSTVYRNGRTLDGKPLAFSVEHGRFIEVVDDIPVDHAQDLGGATVLPGFVDAHCHVMPTGFDLAKLNLDGCSSFDEVLTRVKERSQDVQDGEWLLAVHYDQNKFDEGRHLHRSQLDAVVEDVPVLLRHTSGHASVVNTAALQAAGIDRNTPDPKGGTYVRDESGELTGVLLERAHEHVTDCAPSPTLDQRTAAVRAACDSMLSMGVTCASDMMTGYSDLEEELEAYWSACLGGSPIRLRLYLQWSPVFGPRAVAKARLDALTSVMDPELCRVAGAKIFADGALSAGTAAIHGEFASGGNGKLIYEPERLTGMVQTAHKAGWPVSVHSIGDRSTDHVMDAFESTDDPSRHRIEHAMILSDEQIGRLARLDCHVAMQPEFLMRLRHAYFKQLPKETAGLLNRAKSCLNAGIRLSFNSDRPIVGGDPWDGIRTASERPECFDPSENVTLAEAVGAYTRGGADANGDLGTLGEMREGALADFQLYGGRPEESDGPDKVFVGGELRFSKRA